MASLKTIMNTPGKHFNDDSLDISAHITRGLLDYLDVDFPMWERCYMRYCDDVKLDKQTRAKQRVSVNTALASKRVSWERIEMMLNIVCHSGYGIEIIPTWNENYDYTDKAPSIEIPIGHHRHSLRVLFYAWYKELDLVPSSFDYLIKTKLESVFMNTSKKVGRKRALDWAKNNFLDGVTADTKSMMFDKFITGMSVFGATSFTIRFKFPTKTKAVDVCDFELDALFIAAGVTEMQ